MGELIDTTEMYLRTIYELGEEGVAPLRARIAERLKQTGPTVSQTVARMERDGLVSVHEDRHLVLSESGLVRAAQVMRRHRLAERLLTDVIGLEWHLVHEEACRWEHVISTDVERRLIKVLNNPTKSPYGNPIPALAALGEIDSGEDFLAGSQTLSARLSDGGVHEVMVTRLSESIQAETEVLQALAACGMTPDVRARAELRRGRLVIGEGDRAESLEAGVADHIFVAVDR
jgi:DtxR family transcriptional regulator, Mn-dependent transcriptional regulator